jgi:hypothetical protein
MRSFIDDGPYGPEADSIRATNATLEVVVAELEKVVMWLDEALVGYIRDFESQSHVIAPMVLHGNRERQVEAGKRGR